MLVMLPSYGNLRQSKRCSCGMQSVVYEDGDEEDLNEEEMEKATELYLAEVTVGIDDGSSDSDAYDPLE